jgi:Holliday junction resolvase RusA-like endonuclease
VVQVSQQDSSSVDSWLGVDSLTYAGVWEDDGQIDDLRIIRREVCPGGKVVVRVRQQEGKT